MTAIPVTAHRVDSTASDLRADVERAKRIARLLDSEFSIAGVRFGLDAIVGLVPAVGDAVGFLAGLYPIHIVRKHRLGRDVEVKMIVNLLIDGLAGAVPIIGDFVDVAFKANMKNVQLLERAAAAAASQSQQ